MQGKILNIAKSSGCIITTNGERFEFTVTEENISLKIGCKVDFTVDENGIAVGVFKLPSESFSEHIQEHFQIWVDEVKSIFKNAKPSKLGIILLTLILITSFTPAFDYGSYGSLALIDGNTSDWLMFALALSMLTNYLGTLPRINLMTYASFILLSLYGYYDLYANVTGDYLATQAGLELLSSFFGSYSNIMNELSQPFYMYFTVEALVNIFLLLIMLAISHSKTKNFKSKIPS